MKTICIMCPIGCPLEIEKIDEKVIVKGNTCPRGAKYGEQEFVAPKRVVTSLVRLSTGGVASVKTDGLVLKSAINNVLEEIKKIRITPPCNIGDVVIKNVADSGINIVITSNVN